MNESRKSTHHHRNGKGHRIRRWFRHNKTMILICFVAGLAVAALGAFGLYRLRSIEAERHVTAGNSVNVGSGYRNISYDGQRYQYNAQITTILYAGIDSEGKLQPGVTYTDAPRADSISLVIMDKKNKKMTIMALNRDLMTEVRRYTLSGKDRGTYVTHLGFAYTYGEGGEVSCENLREAVSNFLGGIPINEYVVTNRSSMSFINNLVGGVTVTVPNNDLAADYPELQQGAVVTLDDSNIEAYIRSRDSDTDFSNEGRIARQQSYITSYIGQFQTLVQEDLSGTWDRMQEMDEFVQTSITKNKYLNLVNLLNAVDFTAGDYYIPAGEDKAGELHDEFYVDAAALQDKVIDLFYTAV
ncbi:MAG: LCP family protein [Lachnospiraceae bacterium]|nr:LCP family protein [Lachnospiraceae bacterium]